MTEAERNDRELRLSRVEAELGTGAAAALADHLKLFDERFYLWLARLYRPRTCVCESTDAQGRRVCRGSKDCHGGGFYYSNSARDTDGFEIDIESTVQALAFMENSGMLTDRNNRFENGIPPHMASDLVAFAKSLQSAEDGYFYHPQWGTNIVLSRRGRDLTWATRLIESFGDMPLYDTPNGRKGSLGAPRLAAAEGERASVYPEHLRTPDALRAYLEEQDLRTRSYPVGSSVGAQAAQLINRDREELLSGAFVDADGDGHADGGFVKTYESHFNAHQNPENGLWEAGVYYNSVNGLMKISGTYNSLGIRLPNAEAAFASAVTMATWDPETPDIMGKLANGSVDVYNPWVAIQSVMTNVRRFGTEEEYLALRARLRESAEPMIRTTTRKTAKFAKEDGSYGYTWSYSPRTSQMAPVAVPNTVEGDINGGCIALCGIWRNMCAALGYTIPIFYPSDREVFLAEIARVEQAYRS